MNIKKYPSRFLKTFIPLFFMEILSLAQPHYSVKDLGSLNFTSSGAFGINDSGIVVGQLYSSSINRHAFIHDSTIIDIGTLGGPVSGARRISNYSNVVGVSYINSTQWRGFLYDGNSMSELGTLGGPTSSAYDINDNGIIVGSADLDETYHHAVKYLGTTPTDLGTLLPPGAGYPGFSRAFGINNSGHIVGTSDIGGGISHAFIYSSSMIDINGSAFESIAHAISDNDCITGDARWQPNGLFFAFIYKDGLMQNIDQMGGMGSQGLDVDDDGKVVGWFYTQSYSKRAFLYRDGTMYDLNMLIDSTLGWVLLEARGINEKGQIVGVGLHNGLDKAFLIEAGIKIIKPRFNTLWIAGEKDTIKWEGGKKNQFLQIDFSADSGRSFNIIDFIANADTGIYVWDVPKDILSKKCMIRVVDMVDTTIADTSDVFKIKPYILTRDSSGQYEPYRKMDDQWGYKNIQLDMFPQTWYQQFNYQGVDPFTGNQYSQWQGGYVFGSANSSNYPDWVSWVNTFTENACYISTSLGIYSPTALSRWQAVKHVWGGSCFGIATSNALAFSYKSQFHSVYSNYPAFAEPITILSNDGVKAEVNELFTHQFGDPHKGYRINIRTIKTPTQTVNDLKFLFKNDIGDPRILCIENNNGNGGHGILPYSIEKDPADPNSYNIAIYDNSNPTSHNRIKINTAANGGNGSWQTLDWPGWGGNKYIYLSDAAINYLINPALSKLKNSESPFILEETELEVLNPKTASIKIIDGAGNVTGFNNDSVKADIPGSIPLTVFNGSETPPYGYSLPTNNYAIVLEEFTRDTIETFFFTGNKTFSYNRYDADQTQTDRLYFDGGVFVTNPDQQSKTIRLLNIINETTQEKLFSFSSLELSQNDSVKIENPDSNKIKLISYGTVKDYDIELNYVNENGIGRFGEFNIPFSSNSTHTIEPNWNDVTNTDLKILVDEGNDGIIDDTLSLTNKLTGIGSDHGSLIPTEFRLEQNYPNPFNPSTTISWQSPVGSHQTLKVYDVLGNQVAVLVNEYREAGKYEVEFDASHLSSGVYFYRLQTGSFIETKKMILIK